MYFVHFIEPNKKTRSHRHQHYHHQLKQLRAALLSFCHKTNQMIWCFSLWDTKKFVPISARKVYISDMNGLYIFHYKTKKKYSAVLLILIMPYAVTLLSVTL